MNRVEPAGTWGLKWPVWSLAGYVCLLYPLMHVLSGDPRRISGWIDSAYFLLVLGVLYAGRQITLRQLGLRMEGTVLPHLLLGLLPGLALAGTVPLLDWLIEASDLAQSELFAGAERRVPSSSGPASLALNFTGRVLAVPFIQQMFFTGFFLQALFRAVKPVTAIYLMAVLFVLVHFELKLSLFFIGLTCSWLFHLTGTLWASLAFHISCSLGGWLLTSFYPRVVTFLAFLF